MSNMSYCRHENTLSDLRDVWERWEDFGPDGSSYEKEARVDLVELIAEMHHAFSSGEAKA